MAGEAHGAGVVVAFVPNDFVAGYKPQPCVSLRLSLVKLQLRIVASNPESFQLYCSAFGVAL